MAATSSSNVDKTQAMDSGSETQVNAVTEPSASKLDVKVPLLLQQGVPMYKVSAKKRKLVAFRIDADEGCVLWESKKSGISA